MTTLEFPALLQSFFTKRLIQQRRASPHTVAAYRNTFRLLLRFAEASLRRAPSLLVITDLDAAFLGQFLEHLERERGNCARSRNARLAALHAFFRYVALTEPAHALHCQRVLAIPSKRFERGILEFLQDAEVEALLDAPDLDTWRAARPCAATRRCPDGSACLGVDGASSPGCDVGDRCPRPLRRQGTKAALHAASQRRCNDPPSLAA